MVIATGFFDGVHVGHRKVLGQLVETARVRGEESMVITFWPHPRTVLQKDARILRLLTSLQEKKDLIFSLGVDRIEVLDFSREFSFLTCEEYLRDVVKKRFGGTAVLLGYDNRIGSDCVSPEQAEETAGAVGLEVYRCDAVASSDGAVSSTRIRSALAAGDVEAASQMLGRLYELHGVVVAGNHLGRTIGFPTANMQLYEPLKQLPGNGVYLVEVEVLGKKCYGMCNIGIRPTVGLHVHRTIETNIFDFDEDIYGLDMKLKFVRKIRDEHCFGDLHALGCQLSDDRMLCRSMIKK